MVGIIVIVVLDRDIIRRRKGPTRTEVRGVVTLSMPDLVKLSATSMRSLVQDLDFIGDGDPSQLGND